MSEPEHGNNLKELTEANGRFVGVASDQGETITWCPHSGRAVLRADDGKMLLSDINPRVVARAADDRLSRDGKQRLWHKLKPIVADATPQQREEAEKWPLDARDRRSAFALAEFGGVRRMLVIEGSIVLTDRSGGEFSVRAEQVVEFPRDVQYQCNVGNDDLWCRIEPIQASAVAGTAY